MPAERALGRRLAQGLGAGVAGAVALTPVDTLERGLLGRPPVFDLGRVTRRLLGRDTRGALPDIDRAALGWALRLAYGMGLGAAVALTGWRAGPAALAITALELWAMPAAGATPPARTWTSRERWLLLAHTAAFALTTRAVLRRAA